jgi:hypothetical protein
MTRPEINTIIDSAITNKVTKNSITPQIDGANRKKMLDYVDEKRPYSSYCVFLTQSGTSAPVEALKFENSIGNIIWTRSSVGNYVGTLVGAFPTGKVFFPNSKYCIFASGSDQRNISLASPTENTITLVHDDGTVGIDVFEIYLEVRVYN